jgi:hypothetical protein
LLKKSSIVQELQAVQIGAYCRKWEILRRIMKKKFLCLAIAALVFMASVLFVSWWNTNPNQLPDCGNKPDGPDCTRASTIRPQSVMALRGMIKDLAHANKFERRESGTTNGVSFTSVRFHSRAGLYTIHLFKDSLTIWFRTNTESRTSLTLGDHEFDGFIDYGHRGDPMDPGAQKFDGDLGEGLEYRQPYQKLYEQHFAVIAEKLQL